MKKLLFPALALLAGLIIVAGCKKKTPLQPKPTATETTTATLVPSLSPTPSATPGVFGAFWNYGGLSPSSKARVFWGDMYHLDTSTDMDISINQPWGPGYPSAFSVSDINANNRAGNPTFTDCSEDDFYFSNYEDPGCPGMPAEPVIDWAGLKTLAQNSGCDWSTLTPIPAWYTGGPQVGMLFQVGDDDYPGAWCACPDDQWLATVQPRLDTMQAGAPAGCGITGAALDSQVVYVDTTDGGIPTALPLGNHPNDIVQTGTPPMFRGTFITTGSVAIVGGGGTVVGMTAPAGGWLPASQIKNVNFYGLIVTGGMFSWAGNPVVYGSIITKGS